MFETIFSFDKVFFDLNSIHGAVKKVLSEEQNEPRQYIYRSFVRGNKTHVLARAPRPLNSEHFTWNKVPSRYNKGDIVELSALCNVIKQNSHPDARAGKRPLVGEEAREYFLTRLTEQAGLKVIDLVLAPHFVQKATKHKTARRKPLSLHSQECFATCEVIDEDKFESILLNGMGRTRHLGFGLIMIQGVARD